jgi:imidazole glycerol-phosphate synthase subunit HisH
MITIAGYGLGNVQAIANIYKRLNIPATIATTADALRDAERIILPGVGSFDWAMTRLGESGLRPVLDELVLQRRRPVLGICVGMQMLARRSDEGTQAGLGWIPGDVRRLDLAAAAGRAHLPHMGWNDVVPAAPTGLFNGLPAARFYFLHSYYFAPDARDSVMAVTDYFGEFAAGVQRDHIFGVQFHPEKSHQWGIQLLKNFAEL